MLAVFEEQGYGLRMGDQEGFVEEVVNGFSHVGCVAKGDADDVRVCAVAIDGERWRGVVGGMGKENGADVGGIERR